MTLFKNGTIWLQIESPKDVFLKVWIYYNMTPVPGKMVRLTSWNKMPEKQPKDLDMTPVPAR